MSISSNRISSSQPAINQTSTNKASTRSVGSLSNYATSTPAKQISVGEVIKGEVTDLRNNEVTVTLEDNTVVTGHLENGEQLAIGDMAAFRIKDISINGIVLEALPKSQALIENSTITKALEEAGLPKNDKNRLIVHELMKQGMPINKQSIQSILIQSYTHKTLDISTIVLMAKHHISMENGAGEQLQNHINNTHSMIPEIKQLAELVTDFFEEQLPFFSTEQTVLLGKEMLQIVLSNESPNFHAQKTPDLSFLSISQREELTELLESFSLDEIQKNDVLNGSISLRDAKNLILLNMESAKELDFQKQEELRNSIIEEAEHSNVPVDEAVLEQELSSLPKTIDLFDSPIVKSIFESYHNYQLDQNELAAFLQPEEIKKLGELLENFPISPTLKELISSGDASVKEVLTTLKNVLSFTPANETKELFHSKEFLKIFQTFLLSEWTLTPKDLKDPQKMNSFYDKMYQQLEHLSKLNLGRGSGETASNSLKQNLLFTQTLNDIFTYIPLPLRLKEQLTQADLYVYTKKKDLAANSSNLSVLLHLDMEFLGSLDIHLTLNNNRINAKFYSEEENTKQLLLNNIADLEHNLNEKGYLFQSEFSIQEKSVDIVKDFMEQGVKSTSLKRYTFDIRA
ncbi:flagellar hook-length control protein FliK [Velocimicrobium porci]|uniref:Flagellar hook-length control protein FliK n=1 Tax=Velocimicrobium porci TaxID=2606634 RepID=A0A6L5XV64_9FIRM|nr:flagellar hook-length control protein FliK [Velocimicrobium porci]MSS62397.1 flagellar hook-length control protein FliK [Velocimicrobium porci]